MKTYLLRIALLTVTALVWLVGLSAGSGMDRARVETRVDAAFAKYGVTGSNVLVAILDRGLDWKHNDFRNADGTTRIEYIFDMLDNSGASAPGNLFGVGTIYTKAQIDGALLGGTNLNTRDAVGHGTTTGGIAAGGGRGLAAYRGVAPGARLIVVKLTSDGAPAHDGEAAEAAAYDPSLISIGINFVTTKAAELGFPCVMLLNIGSVGGPTDGTSTLARKIDATVGPGKPGRAFVTGTSDDGGATNRAGGTVAQGEVATIDIQKESASSLVFDLWYPESDRFTVRVHAPGGIFGPYAAPASAGVSSVQSTAQFLYYHLGSNLDFNGATSPKRELWIRLDGPAGLYKVELTGTSVTNGRFDATLNPSRLNGTATPINRFLTFAAPGSIWDLATASNNICPNSYLWRTNWIDIDGIARKSSNQGVIGGLWNGSGVGPTFDGRLGMDVSAPGDSVLTTYNPKSYWATFRFNLAQNGATNYGRASAVSAANPMVTGIIALLLEMDPTLDAAQIKTLLHEGARADAFTGPVPNPNWGYGKVDALASLDRLHDKLTRLQATSTGAGTFQITSRGQYGKTYFFEQSTNLLDWTRISTNVASTNAFSLQLTNAGPGGFIRLSR